LAQSMIKAVLATSLVLALLPTSFLHAQKLQRVRVALSTPTPHMAPLWVGKDKKFFENHGLDVQLILVNSGSLVAQMFAAGELQITANAPASLVSLAASGERLSFFLGLSNTSPFTVVTQPSLRKAEDLKGKKIGTARFGGSSHISALIALEHLGLDLRRDKITLIQTGVDPDRMAALEAKAIDAGMLQRVATKVMMGKGFYPLLNMLQAKIPYQNTGLTIKKDYAAANAKVVDGFTRATVEAYAYIFKKENKQSVKEIIARNIRLSNCRGRRRLLYRGPRGTRSQALSHSRRIQNRHKVRRRAKSQGRRYQGRGHRRYQLAKETRRRRVFREDLWWEVNEKLSGKKHEKSFKDFPLRLIQKKSGHRGVCFGIR